MDGLSVTMQEQYIGGINYVQNSSGLNGIMDDWSYSGTVKTDASTDTQNNTISDSCFVLGAYSSLSQYIRGVVPALILSRFGQRKPRPCPGISM